MTAPILQMINSLASTLDLELTDLGNADRFYNLYKDDLLYCVDQSTWLIWNGAYWEIDKREKIDSLAGQAMRLIFEEARDEINMKRQGEKARWAIKSQDRTRIQHMLDLARNKFAVEIKEFDRDPSLLNCQNGTLDLRTGELRPHNPHDRITRIVNAAYYQEAKCPLWESFLNRVMAGNQNVISFLQRAVGYSLTGNTTEQCLFILHGNGANGKSTFVETLFRLLGEGYARGTPTETIMKRQFDSGIPNDLARLKGARFVTVNEVEQGRHLAENKVKQMTGGDTMTARFMRGEFFDFVPEYKLWIRANHRPEIRGTDNGIWRRIRLIPFEVAISPEEQDPDLMEKLSYEYHGILAWAVSGSMAWYATRLQTPDVIAKAIIGYRAEMDLLGQFLSEQTEASAEFTPSSRLFGAYLRWCEVNNEHPIHQKAFSQSLKERGFEDRRGTHGVRGFFGIALRK